MSKKLPMVLVSMLAICIGLMAMGVVGTSNGETLKMAAALVPPQIDPHSDTAVIPTITFHNVFDALTQLDSQGNLQPALATSWELIEDKIWEFKLRKGVKFHNGEAFTAEDVKFTYERAADLGNPRTAAVAPRIADITEIEIVDDYTVRFHSGSPDPILDRKSAIVKILPADYFQEVGERKFGNEPVGTGPYEVISFSPGTRVVMSAVPDSWHGKPNIDIVELVAIPEATVRAIALSSGDVDMVVQISPDQAKGLESAGFNIVSGHLARIESVGLNTWEGLEEYAVLRDKRVRQALNYAVDKKAIAEVLMRGTTKVADGQLVAEQTFGYNPDLEAYPYDPDRARELLEEAGYPDGFSIRMECSQGAGQSDREIGEVVAGYLEDVGINVEFEVLEYSVFRELFYPAGKRAPLFYECWSAFPYMDADGLLFCFDSTHSGRRYDNPAFDVLYRASRNEMNRDDRETLLQEALRIMYDDPPSIWLVVEPEIFALDTRIKGFTPRADAVIKINDMYFD